MIRSTLLLLSLVSLSASASSAYGQTGLHLLQPPQHGVLRPIAGHSALLYVSEGSDTDSFSVIAEDGGGSTWIDVHFVAGATFITNVDFGGPLALSARTLMSKPAGDGTSSTASDGSAPAGRKPSVVIIYVDQPGEGGDRDPYEIEGLSNVDVGHTFIEVINGATGDSTTIGLYPEGEVSPWEPASPGVIQDDTGHPWDIKYELEITPEQLDELLDEIKADQQNPPTYHLNDCNCTDYVLELLEEIDILIDSQEGTWPGGGGHNPGDLGEDLEALGGVQNPVAGQGDGSSK